MLKRNKKMDIPQENNESDHDFMESMYGQLRNMAVNWFRSQPSDHTLQPTALVHEAFLKIGDNSGKKWRNRVHLYAVAARAMRQILVDHARQRNTAKRGGNWKRISLHSLPYQSDDLKLDLLDLDEALNELSELNDRQARIVEMRFLAGLTIEETAKALSVSVETVKLDWRMARAWLRIRLEQDKLQ